MSGRGRRLAFGFSAAALAVASCTAEVNVGPISTTTNTSTLPPAAPETSPVVVAVESVQEEVEIFERFDLVVELDADYENPFDLREVALDAGFTRP